MTALRAGIIGYGLSGRVFHGPLIDATDGLVVASIVTSDKQRAEAAQGAYPQARIVPDVATLLASANDLDFVVVTTPNETHVPFALEALGAGLPVVVEKPLAPTIAEAESLREASARSGLSFATFQNRRWDADYLTMRAAVAECGIGEVFRLESRMQDYVPDVTREWRNSADRGLGGGTLLDLGAHLIDQAIEFLGEVRSVAAELDTRRPGAVIADDFFLSLEHVSGARSHLSGSVIGSGPQPRFHVQGTLGSVTVAGRDQQEAQLAAGLRPGHARFGVLQPPNSVVRDRAGEFLLPSVPGQQHQFYVRWRDHLRDGAQLPVEPESSLRVLVLLEAARRAAQEGRVVSVS